MKNILSYILLFFFGYINKFSLIFEPFLSIYNNSFNIDTIINALEYDDLINNCYYLCIPL